MIPECVAIYGESTAQKWFTNRGLLAFQHIRWNPNTRSTVSEADNETRKMVDEDIFGFGSGWQDQSPILQQRHIRQEETNPNPELTSPTTALEQRANDNNVHSFASVFGREHYANSTTSNNTNTNTSSQQPNVIGVTFATLPGSNTNDQASDRSFASSAALTTDSTRQRLRDSLNIIENMRSEQTDLANENAALLIELEKLRSATSANNQETTPLKAPPIPTVISPTNQANPAPANKELPDIEADSVG